MKKFFIGIVLFFAFSAVFMGSASASWFDALQDFDESTECMMDFDFGLDFEDPDAPETVFTGPGLEKGAKIVKCNLDKGISKQKSIHKLIAAWSNFLMSIAATVAVVALIWAGFLYITAGGEDGNTEKAKKIIIYVAIGVVLILGSYAIVNTVMRARFGEGGAWFGSPPAAPSVPEQGSVGQGGNCASSRDCGGVLVCRPKWDINGAILFGCHPKAGVGVRCSSNDDCDSGTCALDEDDNIKKCQ